MPGRIEEGELEVDGVRTFFRRVPGDGTPVVYCHGNPTHGADWLPFLRRGGAAVAVDMPGWGRSARPSRSEFAYTMEGLSAHLERCLESLGVGARRLVVHDWGTLGLIGAQRHPELVERLVVINAVPLLPGYRWHWVARLWRRRGVGEAVNALVSRPGIALLLRQARGDRGPMPPEFVDLIASRWDRGTGRAVLDLYRDADPPRLAAAGRDLGRLECPALVLWGERDPYLPPRFGRAFAEALPRARLEVLGGLGHWPWIEDPAVVERVLRFLDDQA